MLDFQDGSEVTIKAVFGFLLRNIVKSRKDKFIDKFAQVTELFQILGPPAIHLRNELLRVLVSSFSSIHSPLGETSRRERLCSYLPSNTSLYS